MMARGTRLHPDEHRREFGEELPDASAAQSLREHRSLALVNAEDLEHVLPEIEPDPCDLHGWTPPWSQSWS
jgi:hypothetical protein